MTNGGAALRILFIWAHALIWTLAPMFGWNRYVPEGNMTACGTDYLTKDWFSRSYILVYSFFVYFAPLLLIIYSYWFIIQVNSLASFVYVVMETKRFLIAYFRTLFAHNRLYPHTRKTCANRPKR